MPGCKEKQGDFHEWTEKEAENRAEEGGRDVVCSEYDLVVLFGVSSGSTVIPVTAARRDRID